MHCKCYFEGSGEVGSHNHQFGSIFLKGVTLTELMIILAIISIMATMALPELNGFFSKRAFYCQADELCAVLNRARDKAMEKCRPWRIIFSPGDGSWFCFGDTNNNDRWDAGEERLGPYHLDSGIFFGSHTHSGPNNTSVPSDGISFTDNRISFSPMGSCNAGTIFINCKEWNLAIRVFPASGTIRSYEYSGAWRELK